MVLENLLGHLQPRPWWKAGDVHLLVENQYDHQRGRLDIEYTFVANGRLRSGVARTAPTHIGNWLGYRSGWIRGEPSEPWTRDAHMVSFIATAV